MAFKMKGSPMYRNFGVGSPMDKKKDKGEKKRYDYSETPEPTKDEKLAFQSAIQNVTTLHTDKDKAKSYMDKSQARTKEGYEKDYREGLKRGQRRRYDKEAYVERGMSEEQASKYATQDKGRVTKSRKRNK